MNGTFYIGAVGLQAQQRALEVVANNVANMNTPSFKRAQVRFSELVSPADTAGAGGADALAGLSGVRADASAKVFDQGELRQTGEAMDLAINGEGLIELIGPGGQTLLWRGGRLKVNADGVLATASGLPLKAMISAPADSQGLTIGADGQVSVLAADGQSRQAIGQIELVRPSDPSHLEVLGDGLYAAASGDALTAGRGGEDGLGRFVQGAVEASNVELNQEMITLLLMQRAYAANAQVVQAGDQLIGIANGLRR